MSNGGYKGASPARETSPEQYPGVWELTEQFQAQADGNWPFQAADCAPKSLRFDGSSAHLEKTFATSGNRTAWSWSCWLKRGRMDLGRQVVFGSYNAANDDTWLEFGLDNTNVYYTTNSIAGSSNAAFRDPAAFYHYFANFDGTTFKIFINNVEVLSSTSLAGTRGIAGPYRHRIGQSPASHAGNIRYFDGVIAECNFIDGQVLSPSDFAFYDGQGIWQPKRFTGDFANSKNYSGRWQLDSGSSWISGPENSFDGILGNNTQMVRINGGATWTAAESIPFTTLRIYGFDAGSGSILVNGTDVSSQVQDGTSGWGWNTITGITSPLQTIRITGTTSVTTGIGGVEIDGNLLLDATVGRNSFHLDFSDGVKDQSGLGNDWSALNLNLGGDFTYSSAHGSNVTTAEFAKMVDSDLNTYGEPSGDFIGFAFAGEKITVKIQNTAADPKSFYIQPATNTTYSFVNGGTWSVSGGSAGGNQWTLNANSTETGTFTVPSNYVGTGRFYFSGNNTDFRIYDISPASDTESTKDISVDSPVNGNETSTGAGGQRRGNYACMNPLNKGDSQVTLSNGNLHVSVGTNASAGTKCQSTIGMSSGKYYCEFTCVSGSHNPGLASTATNPYSYFLGDDAGSWTYGANGKKYHNDPSAVGVNYGASYAAGDVIGVAFDADAGTLTFYKNGASQGVAYTGLLSGPYFFATGGSNSSLSANFGQRSFKHPLSTHSPLATSFLPEPTIKRGDEGFDISLWQGNGSSQTISGLRLNPGLVWIKTRDDAYGPALYDQVRGANLRLRTDDAGGTNPDQTQTDGLSAFTEDGFTLGSHNAINESPDDYVGWTWGGGETTTAIGVGGLNSSAYNTSRVWSGDWTSGVYYTTYTPDKVFDGNLSTNVAVTYPTASQTITINPAISGSVIEVYYARSNNTTAASIGSETLPSTGAGNAYAWHTISATSISSITLSHGNGGASYIAAIKVDGRILVDEFNNSQTWSNGLSGLSNSTITNATRAFNGNPDNYADSTAGFTVDLTGHTFGTGSHTIEVLSGGATSFSVNGSTNLTDPGGGGAKIWTGTHTGELTSLTSSATGASIYYLKIDGKMLLDPGQHRGPDVPSIATNVRANPSTGFSIMTLTFPVYSGTSSVAHGLNSAPHFWMMKDRDSSDGWYFGHKSMGAGHYLRLESNGDKTASQYLWDNQLPDRYFIYNNGTSMTGSGSYLMLAWAPVDGYSAMGSYEGTGAAASAAFVYTGMRPRWIMVKNIDTGDSSTDWFIYDTTRSTTNPVDDQLNPNRAIAEAASSTHAFDILSNGFRVRSTSTSGLSNKAGDTYIWVAFGEHPFASQARAR